MKRSSTDRTSSLIADLFSILIEIIVTRYGPSVKGRAAANGRSPGDAGFGRVDTFDAEAGSVVPPHAGGLRARPVTMLWMPSRLLLVAARAETLALAPLRSRRVVAVALLAWPTTRAELPVAAAGFAVAFASSPVSCP